MHYRSRYARTNILFTIRGDCEHAHIITSGRLKSHFISVQQIPNRNGDKARWVRDVPLTRKPHTPKHIAPVARHTRSCAIIFTRLANQRGRVCLCVSVCDRVHIENTPSWARPVGSYQPIIRLPNSQSAGCAECSVQIKLQRSTVCCSGFHGK